MKPRSILVDVVFGLIFGLILGGPHPGDSPEFLPMPIVGEPDCHDLQFERAMIGDWSLHCDGDVLLGVDGVPRKYHEGRWIDTFEDHVREE